MNRVVLAIVAYGSLAASGTLLAAPVGYRLPPESNPLHRGPGMDAVVANCALCHSLDYVSMQPPRRGREFWQAIVGKMVNTYGAEIASSDRTAIVDYLATQY
jgi:sulfite dehydrogenase (cytochrome) subunit B